MPTHNGIKHARVTPDRCNPGRFWVMHPSNDAVLASCDTEEDARAFVAKLDRIGSNEPTQTNYCLSCGSTRVQYAVWYAPNTDEVLDTFGSGNQGDDTYCADCDENGRDPHRGITNNLDDVEGVEDVE